MTTTGQNTCVERLGTAIGVDCTATGATILATIEAGRTFIPMFARVRLTSVAGFVSAPTISIGTNASAYDSIQPAIALTGLDTADEVYALSFGTIVPAATADVYLNVTVAAFGSYTVSVDIFGYYQD